MSTDMLRRLTNCRLLLLLLVTRKRKAVDDGIQSLERRKLELSADIDSLTASADQLAEKAESSRDMGILVISNAMRKAC